MINMMEPAIRIMRDGLKARLLTESYLLRSASTQIPIPIRPAPTSHLTTVEKKIAYLRKDWRQLHSKHRVGSTGVALGGRAGRGHRPKHFGRVISLQAEV